MINGAPTAVLVGNKATAKAIRAPRLSDHSTI